MDHLKGNPLGNIVDHLRGNPLGNIVDHLRGNPSLMLRHNDHTHNHTQHLPYRIPSWGTFAIWYNFRDTICHGICSLIMKIVWGGGIYHRAGSFTIWYWFPPWGSSSMGFLGEGLPYGIPSGGNIAIWYNFRGGGGGSF